MPRSHGGPPLPDAAATPPPARTTGTPALAPPPHLQSYSPRLASPSVGVAKAPIAAAPGTSAQRPAVAAPLVPAALPNNTVTRAANPLYGHAYYVLGKVAEGEGKLPEAMENYCRTVAIFYQERAVVTEAENRIDALRNTGITTP